MEGRWLEKWHKQLVDKANAEYNKNNIGLSTEEIAVFKLGAIYPDKGFKVKDHDINRNWHGGYKVNYVANYRFATRIAKYAGNRSKYSRAKGQKPECYGQMGDQIGSDKVGNISYGDIININSENVKIKYNNLSVSEKERFRRVFLYGMASHIVTDTFAHSAYYKKNGTYINLQTSKEYEEDEPYDFDNRFYDAQEAMYMVIQNCDDKVMGSEIDFSPRYKDWGKNRKYYLRHILKYAKEAAVDYSVEELNSAYQAINYEP